MAKRAKETGEAELNREIQRFSMRALALAKAVVDGSATDADREMARELSGQVPVMAAQARSLGEAYRAGASRALADAHLDLAFVAANGGIPSSTRLGWYMKEREAAGDK